MKTSLALLIAAVAGTEGTVTPPLWTADLNAARQYSLARSGVNDVMIAWGEQLPSPGSCLDRRIVGAIASHTGSVAVTNIANDLVASVGDRTGMCSPMDTDGIQHVSLVQISSTSNAVIYNGPTLSTNTPVTTVEAPSQQLVSAAGLPSGSSSFVPKVRRRNMMRSESVSLGATGYVTCWNKERGSLSNLRVYCKMFKTDGTKVGSKYLIKLLPVTTDEEATSISLVNMQSDGMNGLSVDSFAIGITYFPPGGVAPELSIGVFSWDSTAEEFVEERAVQAITFNIVFGSPKLFGKHPIQIEKAHGSNPTSLIVAYTSATFAVSQPVHTTNSVFELATPFPFPFSAVLRTPLSSPSVTNTGNTLLFSWLETESSSPTTTWIRVLHVDMVPTLGILIEVGGLTFVGHTNTATIGTGYIVTAINEVVPGEPVLEVRGYNDLP